MSKVLRIPDTQPRVFSPTTTKKLAERMLAASEIISRGLGRGFVATVPWDILLALHVAEDEGRYLSEGALNLPGAPPAPVVSRWLDALTAQGLVERRHDLIALSDAGDRRVVSLIEQIYAAQRELD